MRKSEYDYDSVTEILGLFVPMELQNYFKRNTFKFLMENQERVFARGKLVHKITALDDDKEKVKIVIPDKIKEEVLKSVEAYRIFKSRYLNYETIADEYILTSHKHKYNGTADRIVKTEIGYAIIDWKTSNDALYSKTLIQLAAYANAFEEQNKIKISFCQSVCLGISSGIPTENIIREKEIDRYFQAFLGIKKAFDIEKEFKKLKGK